MKLGESYYKRIDYGCTVRQMFAAIAMQGILSGDSEDIKTAAEIAQTAVECADALIAELDKEKSLEMRPK